MQVADRWHLLKNLGDTVERALSRQHRVLREAADAMRAALGTALAAEGLERELCWCYTLGALLELRLAASHPGRLWACVAPRWAFWSAWMRIGGRRTT